MKQGKLRTLRERAFDYSERVGRRMRIAHNASGPWFAGYLSGAFNGYRAGLRAKRGKL